MKKYLRKDEVAVDDMKKRISVLLSAYNGEKYILEQLESLRLQTRTIDEVLIIDDCSTDHTPQICLDFIDRYHLSDTWRVEINEKNKGWIANFHEGQRKTDGDILMFCDQDDIWLPGKVEQAVDIFVKHPEFDVMATYEHQLFLDGKIKSPEDESEYLEIIDISKNPKDFYIRANGCTMAIRRCFIEKVYDLFVDTWAHDDMMWKLAGANGHCVLVHKSFIQRRIHGGNVSLQKRRHLHRRIKDTESGLKNLIAYKQYLMKENGSGEYVTLLGVVDKHIKGNQLRLRFMKEKKVFCYLKIVLFYRDIYRTTHQMLGDLAAVIRNR